jgi:hypothetical protein
MVSAMLHLLCDRDPTTILETAQNLSELGDNSSMIAKRLETILANEAGKTDLSQRSPADMVQRFQSLREYGLLPKGRGKNAQHLSLAEIVNGILSIATVKPGFAGLVAKVLRDLRPVGGIEASFERCITFGKAVEAVLDNSNALDSLIEIRVSDSEIYKNDHCRATIEYLSGDTKKTANYVGKLAVSLLQPGAEKTFDPRQLISSVITETVFYPLFFRGLYRGLKKEMPELTAPFVTDPEEEDEENRQEERARRLGLTPRSKFLNVGVDNQVTWPSEETIVDFEGYKLILLPKTREKTTSVHIDLHENKLTSEDARTLINRFLSMLTWCDDQFAVLQNGWSGNSVPVAVPKRDLAFTTAHHWMFDRKIPKSNEARIAIALYREGRNAEQNYLISYAVLSYYKIIELKNHRGDTKNWFRDNFIKLKQNQYLSDMLKAFEKDCGTEEPYLYLYEACRTAVAHAKPQKRQTSDPDNLPELRRLHVAAAVLRELARLFIQNELHVSDCAFDGT